MLYKIVRSFILKSFVLTRREFIYNHVFFPAFALFRLSLLASLFAFFLVSPALAVDEQQCEEYLKDATENISKLAIKNTWQTLREGRNYFLSLRENPKANLDLKEKNYQILQATYNLYETLHGYFETLSDNEALALENSSFNELVEDEKNAIKNKILLAYEPYIKFISSFDVENHTDAMVEIRTGFEGPSSETMATDLFQMYYKFSKQMGWKLELLKLENGSHGQSSIKEVIFRVTGKDAYRFLRHEVGMHRFEFVQDKKAAAKTKHGARSMEKIITATIAVNVFPDVKKEDQRFDERDFMVKATTSSGPGGQHVNKSQTAIQITHIPTGLAVKIQDQRSQKSNLDKAWEIILSKLQLANEQKRKKKESEDRLSGLGLRSQSDRIRNYDVKDNVVRDERTKQKLPIAEVLEKGKMVKLFSELENVNALNAIKNAIKYFEGSK